jgi:hypothetical protein
MLTSKWNTRYVDGRIWVEWSVKQRDGHLKTQSLLPKRQKNTCGQLSLCRPRQTPNLLSGRERLGTSPKQWHGMNNLPRYPQPNAWKTRDILSFAPRQTLRSWPHCCSEDRGDTSHIWPFRSRFHEKRWNQTQDSEESHVQFLSSSIRMTYCNTQDTPKRTYVFSEQFGKVCWSRLQSVIAIVYKFNR